MFLANHEIAEAIVAIIGSDSENAIWGQISPKILFMPSSLFSFD